MRATSPGGDADFKGIVAWAGELGYGVRPPERASVLEEVGAVPSGSPVHALDHVDGATQASSAQMFDRSEEGDEGDAGSTEEAADDARRFPDLATMSPADAIAAAARFDSGEGSIDSITRQADPEITGPATGFSPAEFNAGEDDVEAPADAAPETPADSAAEAPAADPDAEPTDLVGDAIEDPDDDPNDGPDNGPDNDDDGNDAGPDLSAGADGPTAGGDVDTATETTETHRPGYFDAPDEDTVQKKRRFFR